MKILHSIAGLALVGATLTSTGVSMAAAPSYNIYLTTAANGSIEPADKDRSFDCSDVIYLFVESASTEALGSELKAIWTDPEGKDRVTIRREFTRGDGGYWSWSGLQLNRPAGASLLQFVDPAAGMSAFIGDWEVRVVVNQRNISTLGFNISC